MTEPTKLFRPSAASKLECCVYFEQLLAAGKRAKAGLEGHRYFADVFRLTKTVDQISSTWRKRARWAIRIQKQFCPYIKGVEETLDLYDQDQNWITDGTLDLWGRNEWGVPTVIDWKPGEYMDHSAQGACYGLMLMDKLNERQVQVVTGYYGTGQTRADMLTYDSAARRVEILIERIRGVRGPEPHELNDWCGMCAKKINGCPRWEEERQALLATPGMPEALFSSLSSIRAAPEALGPFLVAYKRFNSLIEAYELEAAAKAFIEKGTPVPGLKLQSRGYSLVIDRNFGREQAEMELEK